MTQTAIRPASARVLNNNYNNSRFDNGRYFNNPNVSEEVKKFRDDFPNLPGFSKYATLRPQSAKSQSLNFKNGYMMVNSPIPIQIKSSHIPSLLERPMTAPPSSLYQVEVSSPNDVRGRYSLARQKMDRSNNRFSLPFCSSSKLPPFLKHDRRVLLFNAYYEENVLQSAVETKRVHKCEIYFYVEDGTIEIIQAKQENSGIPQGVFLRRSKVEKLASKLVEKENENMSDGGPQYYEINDLKIGNAVEIYSRIFHIVDCNKSTREYVVQNQGWHEDDVAPLSFPRDYFAETNRAKMRRESGVPGVDRKRKMHELKEVMESMLGKQSSTTDRGMFLECGQDALCFHAAWDDREQLYGDVQFFRLFYYLADDTIEILPVYKKNNGRDNFPKLLRRSKLPKDGKKPTASNDILSNYYHWKDLLIGETINVYGRPMLLAKCDSFTKQHYKSNFGIQLKDDIPLEPEEEKVEFVRHIPPYNGFGSEDDSLRSCTGGLNPPPPKRDIAKMREKQGVILRFNGHLLGDKINRRFVIQYFMEDDTIAIREPPIRNSGVMGGGFLRRQAVKKPDGTRYAARDMYIGNVVNFMHHCFELLNADEFTYRLMENDERTFPYSNFKTIHGIISTKKDDVVKFFAMEYDGSGKIDMADLTKCCERVKANLNKQQILTLWRKLDKLGKGKVSFTKVIKIISQET